MVGLRVMIGLKCLEIRRATWRFGGKEMQAWKKGWCFYFYFYFFTKLLIGQDGLGLYT